MKLALSTPLSLSLFFIPSQLNVLLKCTIKIANKTAKLMNERTKKNHPSIHFHPLLMPLSVYTAPCTSMAAATVASWTNVWQLVKSAMPPCVDVDTHSSFTHTYNQHTRHKQTMWMIQHVVKLPWIQTLRGEFCWSLLFMLLLVLLLSLSELKLALTTANKWVEKNTPRKRI